MRYRERVISPLFMLVVALVAFEFLTRLPYAYLVANSGLANAFERYRMFSSIPHQEVMYTGAALLGVLAVFLLAIGVLGTLSYPAASTKRSLPLIGRSIYVWALIFLIIIGSTIGLLGIDSLEENISSKRREVSEDGMLWFFAKMSMFSHVLVSLFYIRYLQTKTRQDLIVFMLTFVLLATPAIVFSLRAIIIALVIELIYIQIFFGIFNLRKLIKISLMVFPVLIAITILRANLHEDSNIFIALINGFERLLQNRYFFDIIKLGTVSLWYFDEPWLGPVSIGFMLELFDPVSIIYYREIGPIIAYDVYKEYNNGVTPGGFLEAILSFGYIGGLLFFGFVLSVFFYFERKMFLAHNWGALRFFIIMFALAKFPIFVNSSLGAFAFQVILESAFLIILLSGLGLVRSGTRRRTRRAASYPYLKRIPQSNQHARTK